MSERYFCETPIEGGRAELAGAEAHHLAHVMRAEPGRRVVLFDGSGAEFDAVVDSVRRDAVQLTVRRRREVDRELPLRLVLAVALPKGERQRWLVEKAVELGVGRLVPLWTARGVAQPVEQALARLRRTVVEASKQCGRNRLMEVAGPRGFAEFVAEPAGTAPRVAAHPAGETAGPILPGGTTLPTEVCVLVGPEGGLTDDEADAARAAGWRLRDLGPRTLRVETAALRLAAEVAAELRARGMAG
jgi:16S rRNA (uracil1498-N3)-methyltransferase